MTLHARRLSLGFCFLMMPVFFAWVATGDWRLLATVALFTAIMAVLGYGVIIAIKTLYVCYSFEIMMILLGSGILVAGQRYILLISAFVGFLVLFRIWSWTKLLSRTS